MLWALGYVIERNEMVFYVSPYFHLASFRRDEISSDFPNEPLALSHLFRLASIKLSALFSLSQQASKHSPSLLPSP